MRWLTLLIAGLLMACPPNLDPQGYTPCASDQECDLGPDGLPRICTEGVCIPSRCGDGKVSSDEECDDANEINTDACTNGCKLPNCGDGITTIDENLPVAEREECDDGNSSNEDGCTASCRRARCGDGTVRRDLDRIDPYFEDCDDGNTEPADACTDSCKVARCGDGVQRLDLTDGQEGFEACDDGNSINTDACTSSCALARCGDGFLQQGEECDDGNDVEDDQCNNRCQAPGCGDGVVQAGEECDDGNADNEDNCTETCRHARCGDEFLQAGEQCDDGNVINTDTCVNCYLPRCGDGFVRGDVGQGQEGYEACDDGNNVDEDACTSGCVQAECGDGIVREDKREGQRDYEACDDGNGSNTDACLNNCEAAACGDGERRQDLRPGQVGFEECDDFNFVNNDACTNGCQNARCGDDIVRRDLGRNEQGYEECEDGNDEDRDDCTNLCLSAECGDGVWRHDLREGQLGFEACDDGEDNNNQLADACRLNCLAAACGDRVVDTGEECDDGDEDERDACRACLEARCGDGVVRLDLGAGQPGFEECDDGNRVDNDECNNACIAPACGDGRRLGNEECDDGNDDDDDACTNECQDAVCGDGILRVDLVNPNAEGYEACDEGANNQDVADSCRANCLLPRCGDGIVDPGDEERCDPGVNGDWSDCSRFNCRPPRQRLAVGRQHVCVWPEDSETIHCWGRERPLNDFAEFMEAQDDCNTGGIGGDRCYVRQTIALEVDELNENNHLKAANLWRGLEASYHGICMNMPNGVWCMGHRPSLIPWGNGANGGWGNQVWGQDNWEQILEYSRRADDHGCVISTWNEADENEEADWSDPRLSCWGDNVMGQLGTGTTQTHETITNVMALAAEVPATIATGAQSTCVATEEGHLWCWGRTTYGVVPIGVDCGENPNENRRNCEPTRVEGLSDVRRVWMAGESACAVTGDERRLHCWGMADSGQLGLDPDDESLEECTPWGDSRTCLRNPRDMGMTGIDDLVISDWFICRLISGVIRCWGTDGYGEFGIGLPDLDEEPWSHLVPDNEVDVDLPGPVAEISSFEGTICALLKNGSVYCWGYNDYGRVGRLGAYSYNTPQFVEIPRGN